MTRIRRAVAAELSKLLSLPSTAVAFAAMVLGPVAVTFLNARNAAYTDPAQAVLSAAPIGTVGAIVLGVVAMSGEYRSGPQESGGGRQITNTLTAMPHRAWLLAAKAVSVVLLVAVAAAFAFLLALVCAHHVLGGGEVRGVPARLFGAAAYWAFTALIALAVTVFTRSGILPLIVLIANGSLVSLSYLLSKVTPAARYLPDLAGIRLFADEDHLAMADALDPVTGGLVMGAWAMGLLAVAVLVLHRRDT